MLIDKKKGRNIMTNKAFKQLGELKVNNTFTVKDMSNSAFNELVDYAIDRTKCYYDHARFNFNLVSNGKVMGLRVYKDYGIYVSLVYPNKEGGYSSIGIAQIINNQVQYNYCYTEQPEELEKFLNEVLKDRTILEDYDQQQIEEALELGDMGMLEDVLGDRCLTEFI